MATSRCMTRRIVALIGSCAALTALVLGYGSISGASGANADRTAQPRAVQLEKHASSATSTLVANISTAPATLDPAEECGTYDFIIATSVYTRLVQFGTESGPAGKLQIDYSKIEPMLATSWTITDHGLVYTFHLRHGVKFSNGTPVTAADVKYSFERTVSMNGCGAYFVLDGHYTPPLIKRITTPSEYTVVITLTTPDAEVLGDWAQSAASIVDPKVVQAHGGVVKNTVNTWMASHVIDGAGPFLLSSYQPDVSATLTANPSYFEQPVAKKIIIDWISTSATLGLDARDGEADVTIGLPDSTVHTLAKTPGVEVVPFTTPTSEQFGFDNTIAPFNNKDVREALVYAVPYKEILDKVVFGYGQLFYGEYQPDFAAFRQSLEEPITENLSKAKSLLHSSGVKLPISFSVDIESGTSAASEIAQILQSVWSQLDVHLSITTLSPTDYTDALFTHKATTYIRLDGPGLPEPAYYLGYDAKCHFSDNLTYMCVPEITTLLTKAETLPASEQQPYWNQIETLWRADYPKIQLYSQHEPVVLSRRVKSFEYTNATSGLQYWGFGS